MNVEVRTMERKNGDIDVVIYINGKFFDCKTLNKKEAEFYEIKEEDNAKAE